MATTPGGLPYPVGTDKVVDGDNAIRALAEALEPKVLISSGVVTFKAGITGACRLHKIGRLVVIDGSFAKATDFVANEFLGTMTAAFAPVLGINAGLHLGGGYGMIVAWGSILPSGEIRGNATGAPGVRQVGFNVSWIRDAY